MSAHRCAPPGNRIVCIRSGMTRQCALLSYLCMYCSSRALCSLACCACSRHSAKVLAQRRAAARSAKRATAVPCRCLSMQRLCQELKPSASCLRAFPAAAISARRHEAWLTNVVAFQADISAFSSRSLLLLCTYRAHEAILGIL